MHFNLHPWFVAAALLPAVAYGATTSYTCKFLVEATPKGLSKQASPFELRFVVDASTRKAYLMGNAGSSEVEVIPNTDGISFVEITASGNVMVTAVTNSGEAVHSRNGIMFKQLVPSQFYGKCTRQ
ncbi:hypothetical protein [Rhodoferax antarcticus]|uniref:hypothetical protein n=1 Tax=Rhodoferax antarcticus TaxID=81479 RepID=UPI0009582A87|nr:hypothetical protein [Rhodoferax antarcticus]APW45389.1 hypothetical protein RA876_02270 [Rhodoferax antarcticus]